MLYGITETVGRRRTSEDRSRTNTLRVRTSTSPEMKSGLAGFFREPFDRRVVVTQDFFRFVSSGWLLSSRDLFRDVAFGSAWSLQTGLLKQALGKGIFPKFGRRTIALRRIDHLESMSGHR